MSLSDESRGDGASSGDAIDLDSLQREVREWCDSMAVAGAPPGTYRFTPDGAPGFYAAADMAIIRWAIGDDPRQLPASERAAWIETINSHQRPADGRYGPEMDHHLLHANGTAVNALTILGGQHRYPVRFYQLFARPERIGPWLSSLSWQSGTWRTSHLVWGGPVCLNTSRQTTDAWRKELFGWMEEQLDATTGSWPRELSATAPATAQPLAPLGCAVHLWPLWRHLGRPVPGVEALAELVLTLQTPGGDWDGIRYGSMDALYVLMVAADVAPARAERYRSAMRRYLTVLMDDWNGPRTAFADVHRALCWVSSMGYLSRAVPDAFLGDARWGDIFDRSEIYDLDAVHPFPLVEAAEG